MSRATFGFAALLILMAVAGSCPTPQQGRHPSGTGHYRCPPGYYYCYGVCYPSEMPSECKTPRPMEPKEE